MIVSALVVAALLSQAEEAPEEPAAAAAAPSDEKPAGDAAPPAVPAVKATPPVNSHALDETTKLYSKWATLGDGANDQYQLLRRNYGRADYNPVLPPKDVVFADFMKLSEAEQAKVIARRFMGDLIGGDPIAVLANVGVPFMVEDHRYDRVEDLRDAFARQLRRKRADRWTLYDINALLPADMEKTYGKPPSRLSNWSWKNSKTVIAVCSVSGHAVILMLKQVGATWQVTGFHD